MSELAVAEFDLACLRNFPSIRWLEPQRISGPHVEGARYSCRLCIARHGLRGRDIAGLARDPEAVMEHLREYHHEAMTA